MRCFQQSIQKTSEDVRCPQGAPRLERASGAVVTDQPPPMSEARWPWLELAIITTVYALQIVIWCLSGEPIMIALRWFGERVGITLRAVLWILAGAASGIGWALFLFWPKIQAGYSTFCAFYAAACL
jgi:hypothetical protein